MTDSSAWDVVIRLCEARLPHGDRRAFFEALRVYLGIMPSEQRTFACAFVILRRPHHTPTA